MMARPRAISLRTNSGVTNAGKAPPKLLAVGERCLGAVEHFLAAEILARRDVDHFLGDDAGFDAGARKAFLDVYCSVRIGIGAGGVIDVDIRLLRALLQNDLAYRHAQIGRFIRRDINLARGGQRARRHLGHRDVRIVDIHDDLLRLRGLRAGILKSFSNSSA
jgi:hypothetical protein